MLKLDESYITGLAVEKSLVVKSIGKCISKLDLNKVRDEWKNEIS